MKTRTRDSEKNIKHGSANLQKNIETVGGKLYLTNERLIKRMEEAKRCNKR